jgi:hypothetical protein
MRHNLRPNQNTAPNMPAPDLRRFAARMAIKASLLLVAGGGLAEQAQASPERTPSSSPVVRGLKELNHAKVNDELTALDGRTSSLYARKGTVTYGFSSGKLIKAKLAEGQQIVHAAYKKESGRDFAFYRQGGHSYSIRLDDPANKGKIFENFYVNNDYLNEDAFRIKRFNPQDISTGQFRIAAVIDGDLFSRTGLKDDLYTGEVGETGREMVRIAQAQGSPD